MRKKQVAVEIHTYFTPGVPPVPGVFLTFLIRGFEG